LGKTSLVCTNSLSTKRRIRDMLSGQSLQQLSSVASQLSQIAGVVAGALFLLDDVALQVMRSRSNLRSSNTSTGPVDTPRT
jgi:hypothetical protein